MNININRLRINFKINKIRRSHSLRNKVFISLHHRLVQVGASEITTIYKEILVAKTFLCSIWTTNIAHQFDYRSLGLYINNILRHIRAEHVLNSEFQRFCWTEDELFLSIMCKSKTNTWSCQSDSYEFRNNMLELDIVRLQELSSCRYVIEQISYAEISSHRSCYFLKRHLLRIRKLYLTTHLVFFPSSLERNFCNGSNRCQSLSAETKGQYIMQIFCCLKF